LRHAGTPELDGDAEFVTGTQGSRRSAHLDFSKPVAIGLFAIWHFLRDADGPAGTVACLRDAVAPGSYLAISHIGTDFFPDKSALAEAVAVETADMCRLPSLQCEPSAAGLSD
jgi:S-adenosyl methyltransferase